MLRYRQLEGEIDVRTLEGFKLTVEQPGDAPVLRIDADGLVHELRAGDVWIAAEFQGVRTRYWMRSAGPPRP